MLLILSLDTKIDYLGVQTKRTIRIERTLIEKKV